MSMQVTRGYKEQNNEDINSQKNTQGGDRLKKT